MGMRDPNSGAALLRNPNVPEPRWHRMPDGRWLPGALTEEMSMGLFNLLVDTIAKRVIELMRESGLVAMNRAQRRMAKVVKPNGAGE